MTYQEFLAQKIDVAKDSGFEISIDELNPALKPHQKLAVQWLLKGGKRALYASFGNGKTVCQLEFCYQVTKKYGGKSLIVLPLGVRAEFIHDAVEILGYEKPEYVKTFDEAKEAKENILLTNYERVRDSDDWDMKYFVATSLDESSILKSYGSKTFTTFMPKFKGVRFKMVATAVPAPNRLKELIHAAGYLEISDTGAVLTKFFKRDSTKANNLTLYPSMADQFWMWLSTWSLVFTKPSELDPSFPDDGYILPDLTVNWHELPIEYGKTIEDNGQFRLFEEAGLGLKQAAHVKRQSTEARLNKVMELLKDYIHGDFDQAVVWVNLNDEQTTLERLMKKEGITYSSLTGSQSIEFREELMRKWKAKETQVLLTKPEMYAQGVNLQQCNRMIFAGISYKFEEFIQGVHRIQRFGQERHVYVDAIFMESEREVKNALLKKWEQHKEMVQKMTDIIKKYGLNTSDKVERLRRKMGCKIKEVEGQHYKAVNADCVEYTRQMETNSVDMILTSIPFCYDESTDVLTITGWKKFCDVSTEDEIATYNRIKGEIEYQHPTHVVDEEYAGEIIDFTGRAFNLSVTPNHRMYAEKKKSNKLYSGYSIFTADEITKAYEEAKRRSGNSDRIFRRYKLQVAPENITHNGNKPEKIMIPKLPENIKTGHGVELYWIETEDFMRLAGWYLSEGHCDSFDGSRQGGRIHIGQSSKVHQAFRTEICEMFERIGLPPSETKNQITVWCRNLAYFLQKEFGHLSANKHIPRWVLDLDGDLLVILRDTMMKGDGSADLTSYSSISNQLRDDFQELCLKTGWRAIISGEKLVNTGNKQIYPEIRHTPVRREYSGKIGCVTVQNGLIIVRRNGFPCISGNSNHYEYSNNVNDFGYASTTDAFFEQMDYLVPELLRVLKPGRVAVVHVKDRVLFGNVTGVGFPTIEPFHMQTTMNFMKHGFAYFGMVTVCTDVVRENNQTYRLGYTKMRKDSTNMGVGCEEYLLLFRKLPSDTSDGFADVRVTHEADEYPLSEWQLNASAFWRDSGDRLLLPEELASMSMSARMKVWKEYSQSHLYNYEFHKKFSEDLEKLGGISKEFMTLPPASVSGKIWDDIVRMRTLNLDQYNKKREGHVCPLQLQIVERCINQYTNKGETVFDPFAGIFTVPMMAVKMGRYGCGVELSELYFKDGVSYCRDAENEIESPTLFDFLGEGEEKCAD